MDINQDEVETTWGETDSESEEDINDFDPIESFVTTVELQVEKEENILIDNVLYEPT